MTDPIPPVDFTVIERARDAIAGHVVRTPLVPAGALSTRMGCQVFLKLENLQRTGSFKDRGAFNMLSGLDADARRRGVITMSAGNHAQGVAYHATALGIPSTIIMPRMTPFNKVAKTEGFGATVMLHGESLDDAQEICHRRIEQDGLTLVHPFDDPAIIAGQGTIGLELLEDGAPFDDLIVPIGGGGLISGIATVLKARRPEITILGVEVDSYPSMADALRGNPRRYRGSTIAEGIAVKKPGTLTKPIVARLVDDVLAVDEASIETAVLRLATDAKLAVEGAGAAGVAALMAHWRRFQGRRVGVIICGGNIDPRILSAILMRGLARDGQLARLRVGIEDQPGVLGRGASLIGDAGGNIVEVYHHRLFFDLPVKQADMDVVVETRDRDHVQTIAKALGQAGFPTKVLSELG